MVQNLKRQSIFLDDQSTIQPIKSIRQSQIIQQQQLASLNLGQKINHDPYRKRREAIYGLNQDHLRLLAIEILQKKPRNRTDRDLDMLVEGTKNIKFFQDQINENGIGILYKLCKYMTHQKNYEGENIITFGDVGTCFYICLSGKVGIVVPIPVVVDEGEENSPNAPGKKKKKKETRTVMTEVKQLGNGFAFGELALLSNKPRAATIVAKQETHLAVLDKIPFTKILGKLQRKQLYNEISFFQSLNFIAHYDTRQCQGLFLNSTVREYQKNEIVFYEGEQANDMFIVKQGEFQFSKKIKIKQENETLDDKLLFEVLHDIDCKLSTVFTHNYQISNIQTLTIFGELELILHIPRQTTVKCLSSQGKLIVFKKKEFFIRFYSGETRDMFNTKIQNEMQFRNELIENFTITQKQKLIKNRIKEIAQKQMAIKPKDQQLKNPEDEIPVFQKTPKNFSESDLQVQEKSNIKKIQSNQLYDMIYQDKDMNSGNKILAKTNNRLTLEKLINQPEDQYVPHLFDQASKFTNSFFEGAVKEIIKVKKQKKQAIFSGERISKYEDNEKNKKVHLKGINATESYFDHYNPFTRMQQVEKPDIKKLEFDTMKLFLRRNKQLWGKKTINAQNILKASLETQENQEMKRFKSAKNLIDFKTKMRLYIYSTQRRLDDPEIYRNSNFYKQRLRQAILTKQKKQLQKERLRQLQNKQNQESLLKKEVVEVKNQFSSVQEIKDQIMEEQSYNEIDQQFAYNEHNISQSISLCLNDSDQTSQKQLNQSISIEKQYHKKSKKGQKINFVEENKKVKPYNKTYDQLSSTCINSTSISQDQLHSSTFLPQQSYYQTSIPKISILDILDKQRQSQNLIQQLQIEENQGLYSETKQNKQRIINSQRIRYLIGEEKRKNRQHIIKQRDYNSDQINYENISKNQSSYLYQHQHDDFNQFCTLTQESLHTNTFSQINSMKNLKHIMSLNQNLFSSIQNQKHPIRNQFQLQNLMQKTHSFMPFKQNYFKQYQNLVEVQKKLQQTNNLRSKSSQNYCQNNKFQNNDQQLTFYRKMLNFSKQKGQNQQQQKSSSLNQIFNSKVDIKQISQDEAIKQKIKYLTEKKSQRQEIQHQRLQYNLEKSQCQFNSNKVSIFI